MANLVYETSIVEYPLARRGKVRDIYDLGEWLLFIASDLISAFDVVKLCTVTFSSIYPLNIWPLTT